MLRCTAHKAVSNSQDRQTDRQRVTDRQTDRETDRRTDRQRDGQTDRQDKTRQGKTRQDSQEPGRSMVCAYIPRQVGTVVWEAGRYSALLCSTLLYSTLLCSILTLVFIPTLDQDPKRALLLCDATCLPPPLPSPPSPSPSPGWGVASKRAGKHLIDLHCSQMHLCIYLLYSTYPRYFCFYFCFCFCSALHVCRDMLCVYATRLYSTQSLLYPCLIDCMTIVYSLICVIAIIIIIIVITNNNNSSSSSSSSSRFLKRQLILGLNPDLVMGLGLGLGRIIMCWG